MKIFNFIIISFLTFGVLYLIYTRTHYNIGNEKTVVVIPPVTKVIDKSQTYIGTPYVLGGNGYSGIDCSGLMVKSFQTVNLQLPRRAIDQKRSFSDRDIRLNELRKGDLVFFVYKSKYHVGLVTENNSGDVFFIHSSKSNGRVLINKMEGFWCQYFIGGKRVFDPNTGDPLKRRVVESMDYSNYEEF